MTYIENMTKGQLAYEQKRADKKGMSLDDWLATKATPEPVPLLFDSEQQVLRKLSRADDTLVFFVSAAKYIKNKPVKYDYDLFTAEPEDVEKARALMDQQNITKSDLNSCIATIFSEQEHRHDTRLATFVLAYMSYTKGYDLGTNFGKKGFTLKVLYTKKHQVLCPNEFTGSYDEIMSIAEKFEKKDKKTIDMFTRSIFGHVPKK